MSPAPKVHPKLSFVLVAPGLGDLPRCLRAAFTHPWVASYQIGFGPPLINASEQLRARARKAASVLDKLDLYLTHCLLDAEERIRLADLQRRLAIRRFGPLEAELLARADVESLDLTLRLYIPSRAPEKVQKSMTARGVAMDAIPEDCDPQILTGRFVVHLADPANDRLLHVQAIADVAPFGDALALELQAPGAYHDFWSQFMTKLAEDISAVSVMLADPAPHARLLRNGERG